MAAKRSPKAPMLTQSTLSPGDRELTTAASSPPVPEALRIMTSFFVRKKSPRRSDTRLMSAANSRPRWFTIGCAMASRMSGGTGVGPGMRRFCAACVMGRRLSCEISQSYGECPRVVNDSVSQEIPLRGHQVVDVVQGADDAAAAANGDYVDGRVRRAE